MFRNISFCCLMIALVLIITSNIDILADKALVEKKLHGLKVISGKDVEKPINVKVKDVYKNLPLYFIKNNGQIDDKVKYYEKGRNHSTFFTKEGIYLSLTNGQYNSTHTRSRF